MIETATKLLDRWMDHQRTPTTTIEARIALREETAAFLNVAKRELPAWANASKIITGAADLFRRWLDFSPGTPRSKDTARSYLTLRTDTTNWFLRRLVDMETAADVVAELGTAMPPAPRLELLQAPAVLPPDAAAIDSSNRFNVHRRSISREPIRIDDLSHGGLRASLTEAEAINLAAWLVATAGAEHRARFERVLNLLEPREVSPPGELASDAR